jgi:KaiC/GvpD/RAD55 family RecA-like ATPase
MLTIQEDPLERKDGSSSSIEFESDSIILIYFIMKKNKRYRLIEIFKMRGTKHSTEIHKLDITKKGIIINGIGSLE